MLYLLYRLALLARDLRSPHTSSVRWEQLKGGRTVLGGVHDGSSSVSKWVIVWPCSSWQSGALHPQLKIWMRSNQAHVWTALCDAHAAG